MRDERTFAVIGAAMAVHRELGCGFLEAVYQQALACELAEPNIPFAREVELPVLYKGQKLNAAYRADFVCFDSIIVEVKAVSQINGTHEAQVINYLKATRYEVGLLVNFGSRSLEHKRFILSNS